MKKIFYLLITLIFGFGCNPNSQNTVSSNIHQEPSWMQIFYNDTSPVWKIYLPKRKPDLIITGLITDTDYRPCVSDGPSIITARVTKVLSGDYKVGNEIKFNGPGGFTANLAEWEKPWYTKNEKRIIFIWYYPDETGFLKYTDHGQLPANLYYTDDKLADLTLETLKTKVRKRR